MKHVRINVLIMVSCIVLLPGCGRVIDWGKNTFYQGDIVPIDASKAQKNIRSIAVYDQFTTRAIFDALLLSDEVRMVYTDMYARKSGKNEDQYKAFLRRQLEENKHYISFYVLSLYEKPLGESTSEWNIFLQVDTRSGDLVPVEVRSVEIPAEYRLLFGKKFNRFKVAYSVKFATKDAEDAAIITDDTRAISLIFRALDKEVKLTWNR